MGSGLAVVYPGNRAFGRSGERRCRLGFLDAQPLSHHSPAQSLISGLSLALVVVEASARSGSLISARLALEQDREVMAVPGRVDSELSRGTHWLIKNGAKLVETWEDVAEELPSPLRDSLLAQTGNAGIEAPNLSPEEEASRPA
jgi:DNA processing protein